MSTKQQTQPLNKTQAPAHRTAAPEVEGAPLPARNPFEGTAKKAGASKDIAKKSAGAPAPPRTVAIEESIKQAGSLTLKGTFLSGERRLALINDRFYAEGESLRPSTLKAAWRVAEVQAHRVVLEHQGKQVELKYADRTAKGPAVPAKTGLPTPKGNVARK